MTTISRSKNRITKTVIVGMVIISTCISCKKKEEAPAPAGGAPVAVNPAAPAPEGAAGQKGETASEAKQRKIILNHSVSIIVKDYPAGLESLTKLAESSGGYIFKSSRNSRDRAASWGDIGLRVPAGKAGGVLGAIRRLGNVENENSTAEDITEGYVDLEARLKNARSSEARLQELFRKAGEVADVLEVEQELTRVRGDIETFEAKKKNWDLLTEMVTIDVRMREESSGFPSADRIWTPVKTAFGSALIGIVDSLHGLIVVLAALIPWAAVFGPLAYFYLRKRRKIGQNFIFTPSSRDKEGDEGDTRLP